CFPEGCDRMPDTGGTPFVIQLVQTLECVVTLGPKLPQVLLQDRRALRTDVQKEITDLAPGDPDCPPQLTEKLVLLDVAAIRIEMAFGDASLRAVCFGRGQHQQGNDDSIADRQKSSSRAIHADSAFSLGKKRKYGHTAFAIWVNAPRSR